MAESSGQLRSYLDSKQRIIYFLEYTSHLPVLMLAQNILDTDKPSLCTTLPTTSPPDAHPKILDFDTAEKVVLTLATKRDNQDFFTKVKRTKTTHSLSLPNKRVAELSLMNSSTSYNKKTKP
ncbi:hypothetical protein RIR_jg7000.t1 [Rhizophagus irregularis DAOM 181602=DAOM 197198]|nr:hypothetical protein RIR_jg7000.t1 [Rhizophagus irregularis DAOM 181602=DAOM 197198]